MPPKDVHIPFPEEAIVFVFNWMTLTSISSKLLPYSEALLSQKIKWPSGQTRKANFFKDEKFVIFGVFIYLLSTEW